jgi:sortase A
VTTSNRRRRSLVRRLGTLLIAAGVAALAWTAAVTFWQDPLTAVYTHYQQRRLADRLEQRSRTFRVQVPAVTATPPGLAERRRLVAAASRRYRLGSKDGDALGRLRVPRLGLNVVFVQGTDKRSLQKGPGLDRRTFMPGEGELAYIAGHRTTYGAPFSRIDDLRAGDPVTVELPYATLAYRVTRHVIVPANDLGRLESPGRELLALQACHPRFFATERYIVYAKPVGVQLRPPAAGTSAAPAPSPR